MLQLRATIEVVKPISNRIQCLGKDNITMRSLVSVVRNAGASETKVEVLGTKYRNLKWLYHFCCRAKQNDKDSANDMSMWSAGLNKAPAPGLRRTIGKKGIANNRKRPGKSVRSRR
eukprot:SAG31_NODE_9219_length_1314_cov_2.123457_2_plen_116_part_00